MRMRRLPQFAALLLILGALAGAMAMISSSATLAHAATRVSATTHHTKSHNPHERLRKKIPLWFRHKLKPLRGCENYGSYRQIKWNGFYKAYQFTAGTWYSLGYRISPLKASPPLQDWAAWRLYRRDGANSWPVCRYKAGL